MRVLVTGADGQVGRALSRQSEIEICACGRAELDILRPDRISAVLDSKRPDIVVNAAAYTAVDKAEEEEEAAFQINRDGPGYLAERCASFGIPLVHISTDYVFDGSVDAAYSEVDKPNPLNVYGKSKLAGEEAVRQYNDQHIILRTSWVFSQDGSNFLKTMLRLFRERSEVQVVSDQYGRPTSARQISRAILEIARRVNTSKKWGTYHYAGAPSASWYDFAVSILDSGKRFGLETEVQVVPISTNSFPAAAKRPMNSILNTSKIERVFGIQPILWEKEVQFVVGKLLESASFE